MATVDLTVAADLSALRRQLAEIPGLSADAATKMSAELNKSIKSAEKASLTAAKASKAAADTRHRDRARRLIAKSDTVAPRRIANTPVDTRATTPGRSSGLRSSGTTNRP